jgi:Leucine-rich repeat (LRR) protein
MKKLFLALALLFLALPTFAQEPSPYEIALQRIEEARVSGAAILNLSNIGLEELPPEIDTLVVLRELYLPYNQLRTLPPEIAKLENLEVLQLNYNEITYLPPEIASLHKLKWLELASNQLSYLPDEFENLTNLCMLNLRDNQLTHLPTIIHKFHQHYDSPCGGVGLFIEGNPLISPPPEVIAQGTPAILDYLRNEAWWHLQRLIVGGVSSIGIVAAIVLGLRWRIQRGKKKKT